jgi:Holliday junction resolvase
MSGRCSRRKDARTECSIVNALQPNGIAAVHVPLSGAVGGRFAGDIVLPLIGRDLCIEVKARYLAAEIAKLGAAAPVFGIAQAVENSLDIGVPGS